MAEITAPLDGFQEYVHMDEDGRIIHKMTTEVTFTLSYARKVNDSNYGSHEVFFGVAGVTKDTPDAEIEAILERSKSVLAAIQAKVRDEVKALTANDPTRR